MKVVIWNLVSGGKDGQESRDQKLAEGLSYIEMLKSEGEVVVSVENMKDFLRITLE